MRKSQAISLKNAEHYLWGGDCDGWYLVKSENLSVIQERMPPGRYEVRHYHERARQFFFILSGEAVFELDGRDFALAVQEGIEVPPRAPHRIRNTSKRDVFFLVVSQPNSHGDKVVIE